MKKLLALFVFFFLLSFSYAICRDSQSTLLDQAPVSHERPVTQDVHGKKIQPPLPPVSSTIVNNNEAGTKISLIALSAEIVSLLRRHALFFDVDAKEKTIPSDIVKFLKTHDPYANYFSQGEYTRFLRLQRGGYVGIGMEIKPDRSGRILCFPYPGSPAEKAGIRSGDQLFTVNNTSVDRDSLSTISIMTGGEPGTEVQLAISSGTGPKKQVTVQREQLSVDDVSTRKKNGFLIIQLRSFRQGTKKKLLEALKKSKHLPVILDLRKNSGGDLAAAISSATIFLEKKEVVVRIQKRNGRNPMTSSTDMLDTTVSIYIWQDAFTASSAEVFIAALTENDKAVSIGRRTFGKGTMQDVFTLHDNSALVLTTGRLLTPDNFDFDGLGLPPDITLLSKNLTTEEYLVKTKELLTP